jgi:hypothetical protein
VPTLAAGLFFGYIPSDRSVRWSFVQWSGRRRPVFFFFLKKEEEGRTGPVDAHARGDDETGRSATMRRACVSTYPLLTQ